jgi:two-component system OmpR family response regulator
MAQKLENARLASDATETPDHRLSVLLIEDECELAANTAERLEACGWAVSIVTDGEKGFDCALNNRFDVLIVDRMLPLLDGLSLVAKLRAYGVLTPALFVTAMGSVADRVAGLEGGGDDYLVKPFSFEEMRARLHILVRRRSLQSKAPTELQTQDLVLDRLQRSVRRSGRAIELLPLEFKLLEFLMLHAGQVVTRMMLLEKVWGFRFDPRTNIVETHISRLRAKLDASGSASVIATVRGAGYVIKSP